MSRSSWGAGGVGTFGVQLAHVLGAHVVAIDVDAERLEALSGHGADLAICSDGDIRNIKKQVRSWVKAENLPQTRWKIFETSGHPAGQELAYALLTYDAHLGVVGYTREKVSASSEQPDGVRCDGTWHMGVPTRTLPGSRGPRAPRGGRARTVH